MWTWSASRRCPRRRAGGDRERQQHYRKGHRYLTVVADHDRAGAVVWAGEGRSAATLEAIYAELGADRCGRLAAISLDMGAAYKTATDRHAPQAAHCVDPFHVVKAANEALESTRRWAWNRARAQPAPKRTAGRPRADAPPPTRNEARWTKRTRWALLKDPANLTAAQRAVLDELRRSVLGRAYLLKEELRDLHKLPHACSPRRISTAGSPGRDGAASQPS